MTEDNPNPHDPEPDERPVERNERPEGKEMEEFFQRLPGNFGWPKPDAAAVAAAVEAIHRMSGGAAALSAGAAYELGNACPACGGSLPAGARFCIWCGVPTQAVAGDDAAPLRPAAGQHHVHHHYHHLVPGPAVSGHAGEAAAFSVPRGRAPGVAGGRAETGARQVVQHWAHACNTRHIEDLMELYAADATLIRSSVAPVRSLQSIREFLGSLLEAGFGEVEMESLRVEVMGDIALDLGRCKMLVPVAMGKRREERGKYLVVLVKQPAGTWKILADCWSADLAVSAPPEPAPRKGSEPIQPLRKTR